MQNLENNIAVKSDSYKASHAPQYPPGTTKIKSYLESRGCSINTNGVPLYTETEFIGLQYILKKHMVGKVVTMEMIDQAEQFWNAHFGPSLSGNGSAVKFNREGWEHIVKEHDGKLPIRIKAVPEGTVVPLKNVLMTIENTDPKCFWLTNFLETLLMQIWYPITVATNSRECKKIILKYLYQTGDPNLIGFKLHDFGFRGVSSYETSAIGGFAHLSNFLGTDTVSAIVLAMNYYNAEMCGYSVPATEHSTMTSWGKANEAKAYENAMKIYEDAPIVSIVSDSFDIFNATNNIFGEQLKPIIEARAGTVVIRPDSGDPVEVNRKLLQILDKKFGSTVNDKGYKVLNPKVRIIQGDGIDLAMIEKILIMMKKTGYSADNMTFGSGGGLLQKFDRDTLKFAIKCSYAIIDGKEVDVQKDPVTAPGKKSKKGELYLINGRHGYKTVEVPAGHHEAPKGDVMRTVFENGELLIEYTLEEIRDRAQVLPSELGIGLEEKV